MRQYFNVFISSTSKDLGTYREAIREAVMGLKMYPIMMEDFNASDNNALQKCYDEVQQCDIFIGLYAHRYGFVPDTSLSYKDYGGTIKKADGKTSITHWEFIWAQERNIPVLCFVVDLQTKWDTNLIDSEPQRTHLNEFKQEIQRSVVKFFSTPDDLKAKVALSLAEVRHSIATKDSQRNDFYQHIPFPLNYVRRKELLGDIKSAVLKSDTKRSITAIHGMGGIGKSVMARALCEDTEVQNHFMDGILWARVGQQPDLNTRLREWIIALGGMIEESSPTLDSLRAKLGNMLENKTCLLIIDDVWERKHAEAFITTTSTIRFIITTRDAEIARALHANLIKIQQMNTLEAVALLEDWSDNHLVDGDLKTKEKIVDKLGKLPLAIRLAGAQLQRRTPKEWLMSFDVMNLKLRRVEDIHDSLETTFQLSLNALDQETQQLFTTLAIFKEDEAIPLSVVLQLWEKLNNIPKAECKEILYDLSSRALLELTDDLPPSIILHDLLREFINSQLKEPNKIHRALLDSYNPQQKAWHTIIDDGYLYDHLVYHLAETNDEASLITLFQDTHWLHARFVQNNYLYDGFSSDVMITWQFFAHHRAVQQIKQNQEPIAIADCIRYALIRTSINSLASNYPANLVTEALKRKLEGWTTSRAISIAKKITHIEQRVLMSVELLQTELLKPNEIQEVKNLAITTLNNMKDPGSWSQTLKTLMPVLSLEERASFWSDVRLGATSDSYMADIIAYMPPHIRANTINQIIKHWQWNQSLPNFYVFDVAKIAPFSTEQQIDGFLQLSQKFTEYDRERLFAVLHPYLTATQKDTVYQLATEMQNINLREKTISWIQQNQPPIIDSKRKTTTQTHIKIGTRPLALIMIPHLSNEELKQNLEEALVIQDERLMERAIYNLSNEIELTPLKPINEIYEGVDATTILQLMLTYSEERRAKTIIGLIKQFKPAEREQALLIAQNIKDEWYRASSLWAFLPYQTDQTALIQEIRLSLANFILHRAERQREYLLHFLSTRVLFSEPIMSDDIRLRIIEALKEIDEWVWID
jgi:hypothetical protein